MTRTGPSGAGPLEGADRVGDRPRHARNTARRARRAPARRGRARLLLRVATSVRPARPRRSSIALDVLVAEDRGDDRPLARLEPLEQPVDGLGRVGAVADLVGAAALEPAGKRDLDRRASIGWPAKASAASRAPPSRTSLSRDEAAPFVVGQHDGRAGLRDRELLARDLLARVAEDVGVLEADVRQQDDARVDDVRRVEPAAESGLDDGGVDTALGEVRERGRGQRLELRRVRRSAAGRTRATARSNVSGSVSRRSCQPLTCGDVYAPTSRPSRAQQRRDRARRGRLSVRADDVDATETRAADCRARRAARACGRGRTPRATARATRPSQSPSCVELTPVALELLALGLDDLGGRVLRRSARWRASSRARSISLRRRCALGLDVAVRLLALRLDDRVEDPLLARPRASSAARRCAGTSLAASCTSLERAGLRSRRAARATARRSAASRARAGATRSPPSRAASRDAAASAAARAPRAPSRARRRRRRRAAA